jgi:hypothetical protein
MLEDGGLSISVETPPRATPVRSGGGRGKSPFETLEQRYADDPELLRLYKKKLPMRGWAGKKDATEKEYVRRVKAARAGKDGA